ncbi:MAG: hypothetical protein ACTSRS_16860 [Candidatus Helarchaeota archaeon]
MDSPPPHKLIFVYNVNSDFFNLIKDFFHKALRPATYPCNLCGITYSLKNFGMKKDWKNFLNQLNIPSIFLRRDEFQESYPDLSSEFPVAYLQMNDDLLLFISKAEMDSFQNLEMLETFILKKGKKFGIITKSSEQ